VEDLIENRLETLAKSLAIVEKVPETKDDGEVEDVHS